MFILDPTQKRTSGHRLASGAVAGLMIALILPLAAFTPWMPPGNDSVERSLTADVQAGLPQKKKIWAPGEIPRHADLASKLFSSDSEARWAAAQALGTIGDEPALKVLRSAIDSGDPDVQMTAMKELAAIGDPATVEVFIKALEAEDPKVRSHAAIDLVTVLGSDSPKARRIALTFLTSGKERHLPAVYTKALEGATDKARDWVARSLMKLLYDEPLDVRMGIMESLAFAGDPQFAEAFGLMLKKDPNPKMRYLAVKAIGSLPKIRDEDLKLLIDTLLTDEHPAVRSMAALTLGMMADARAKKALEKALNDDAEEVRDNAMKALTLIKQGKA